LTYELSWNENVKADLRRLSKSEAARIIAAVKEHLSVNTLSCGRPLHGMFKGLYRYRRGEYRVIFAVDHEVRIVRILHIRHRKDAYR
jgi:mRNA interferase RelE/StbE